MVFVRFGKAGASLSFSRIIANASFDETLVFTDTGEESGYERGANTALLLLKKQNIVSLFVSIVAIIKKFMISSGPAIVLMPSPFDWLLMFKKGGLRSVYVIVHDDKTHKGDKMFREWITQSFWRLCKPNIVTLSIYVRKSLENQGFHVSGVVAHPHFIPKKFRDQHFTNGLKKVYDFGIFGRLKSYQGRDFYEIIRGGISSSGKSLIICGGDNGEDFQLLENEVRHSGGVSDDLFFELMAKTRTIILPYTEATQSGIIPNAIFLGCKILTTKVGGIPEQDINQDFIYFELIEQSILMALKTSAENSISGNGFKIVENDIIDPANFYKSLKIICNDPT